MLLYCTNIHPAETLAEVETALATHTAAVKAKVSPDTPYPVGLRLSAAAVAELTRDGGKRLQEFSAKLQGLGMFVPCVNGFPYGAFHGRPVKAAVYQPDWSTRERFEYTVRLGSLLSALLPPGGAGNISTVPLAYRTAANRDIGAERSAYVHAMVLMAIHLETLFKEKGQDITLALEPEPDCLLEDTQDVLSWFEDELLVEGKRWMLHLKRDRRPEDAEEILRRHIGICLDTCHFAVAFEEPLAALRRLQGAGIRVARVQLSAAIRATAGAPARAALRPFIDKVYLHQTKARVAGSRWLRSFPDLTEETLAALPDGAELRSHFHVPLFFDGDGILTSTHVDLSPAFFGAVRGAKIPLEIETYTFHVLPPMLRRKSVEESIVEETQWVQERM